MPFDIYRCLFYLYLLLPLPLFENPPPPITKSGVLYPFIIIMLSFPLSRHCQQSWHCVLPFCGYVEYGYYVIGSRHTAGTVDIERVLVSLSLKKPFYVSSYVEIEIKTLYYSQNWS